MLTKKLRSISMVCLALVMALSLCFGIANFSNVKSASADTAVFNLGGTSGTGSGGKIGLIASGNAYYGRGSGSPTADSNGVRLRASTIVVFSLTSKSSLENFVLYNPKTSAKDVAFDIYSVSDNYYSLVETTQKNANKLANNASSFEEFSSIADNTKLCTASEIVGSSAAAYSYSATIDAGKNSFTITPSSEVIFSAGKYALFVGTESDIFLSSISVKDAVKEYNVTFNTNSGSDISAQSVKENGFAQEPDSVPTRFGYNFTGWFADADLTTKFDFDTTAIVADTVIYAGWELDANVEKPEITAFDAVANVEINFGTAKEDIALPTQVTSGEYSFPVTWSWDKEYDASALQNYSLTGNVEVDEAVYTVSAQAPTMQVIVNEVAVEGGAIEGTFYTFDNATIANLPSVWTENGVDFEIDWNAYVADSATISGSLVAKTGYDVSNAQVTANVQKAVASKSINFINDGVNAGAEYNSVLEAAGYSVTGTWTYEKSESSVTADNIEYMGIKGALATITMFLDKPATVTIAAAGNSASTLKLDGITVKSGTQAVMVKSYELEAGAHTLESTVSGKNIFIKFINIQYEDSTSFIGYSNSKFSAQSDASATLPLVAGEKAGYEFIGWSNGNGVYAPGADITEAEATAKAAGNGYMGTLYTAVYAKAEYLGVQFKTAGNGAIRFGFMISAVNAGDEAVALSADLLSDATFTFVNLSNGKSANLVPTTLAVGSDETNLYTNLAITGMDAAKSANVLTANLSINVNGVAIAVNGSETESITAKAQKALEAGQLNQDQAGVYGA